MRINTLFQETFFAVSNTFMCIIVLGCSLKYVYIELWIRDQKNFKATALEIIVYIQYPFCQLIEKSILQFLVMIVSLPHEIRSLLSTDFHEIWLVKCVSLMVAHDSYRILYISLYPWDTTKWTQNYRWQNDFCQDIFQCSYLDAVATFQVLVNIVSILISF